MLMDVVEERCDGKEVTSSAALVTRRQRFTALEPPLQGKSTAVGRKVVMCLLFEILRQGVNALSNGEWKYSDDRPSQSRVEWRYANLTRPCHETE